MDTTLLSKALEKPKLSSGSGLYWGPFEGHTIPRAEGNELSLRTVILLTGPTACSVLEQHGSTFVSIGNRAGSALGILFMLKHQPSIFIGKLGQRCSWGSY